MYLVFVAVSSYLVWLQNLSNHCILLSHIALWRLKKDTGRASWFYLVFHKFLFLSSFLFSGSPEVGIDFYLYLHIQILDHAVLQLSWSHKWHVISSPNLLFSLGLHDLSVELFVIC